MNLHLQRARIDRLIGWSPVLILAAVATLTYWLDAQVQMRPAGRDGSSRHDPDLVMEDFSAVVLGPDGKIRQSLKGARADHFPDDGTTDLTKPVIVVTEPDKPRLEVTAERARMSGDRENAYFYGKVRVTRDAVNDDKGVKGPFSLASEYLHLIPKKHRLQTDQPVTMTEPRAIIRGTGLDYDHESRTLRILSGVSGEFTPPKR